MNKCPQKTTSNGPCVAVRSAASEYASLGCTGGSCRTPKGSVSGQHPLARGNTTTSPIRSHAASEDKKCRLYSAMPPSPPNASVTSARTRIDDLATSLSPENSLKGITLLSNSLFLHGQNVQ